MVKRRQPRHSRGSFVPQGGAGRPRGGSRVAGAVASSPPLWDRRRDGPRDGCVGPLHRGSSIRELLSLLLFFFFIFFSSSG
eukprot:670868-Pyramimonas_sp.AAC.1